MEYSEIKIGQRVVLNMQAELLPEQTNRYGTVVKVDPTTCSWPIHIKLDETPIRDIVVFVADPYEIDLFF